MSTNTYQPIAEEIALKIQILCMRFCMQCIKNGKNASPTCFTYILESLRCIEKKLFEERIGAE